MWCSRRGSKRFVYRGVIDVDHELNSRETCMGLTVRALGSDRVEIDSRQTDLSQL